MDTSSFLGKAVSRYSRSLSPEDARSHSNKKHPRWRTPSPISASMIPPPIVASIYAASSSTTPPTQDASISLPDLAFFRRKQRQLEADLQVLLDAQAEALLSGFTTKPGQDDALSTGSSTPTTFAASSRSTGATTPTIQRQKKIGLAESRKALYNNMRRLALLKAQEFDYLSPHLDECDAIVSQLQEWERKRNLLEERTSQIHKGEEHRKAKELRRKADDMQPDIDQLEASLANLKAHQDKLRREALDCENEVDAKLTSYTASLAMLEQKTNRFLLQIQRDASTPTSTSLQQSLNQTPSLEAAHESFNLERKQLRGQQRSIEKEREALDQGADVWKHVVKHVSEFERKLREDMARLGSKKDTKSRRVNDDEDIPSNAESDMKHLLAYLDQTTLQLESNYKLAQTRDWKLLVAAIGAELEAFLKGKEILEAALAASDEAPEEPSHSTTLDPGTDVGNKSIYEDFCTPKSSVIRHVDDGEAINNLNQAFEADKNATVVSSDTDNESDGPDPDLLVSHQDTDTD